MKKFLYLRFPVIIFLITGFFVLQVHGQPYRLTEEAVSIRMKPEAGKEEVRIYSGDYQQNMWAESIPMLGEFSNDGDTLEFRPVIPFRPGKTFSVVQNGKLWFSFTVPEGTPSPPASVSRIYPSTDTLPSNQLKIYLHFSQPMREGVAHRYVSITDVSGDTLESPFLKLQPELWDKTGKRLTLWFDPGRVKRALGPNEMAGTPLNEGRSYTLFIDRQWPDKSGQPLSASFSKSFYVEKADRIRPDIQLWKVYSPSPESKDAVRIAFGESMDHALAEKAFTIINPSGEPLSGKVEVASREAEWLFYPEDPWKPGDYQVRIEARLEDLAGNNLNRLFDRDLESGEGEPLDSEYYFLRFQINN